MEEEVVVVFTSLIINIIIVAEIVIERNFV